jgi:hypothetical protein
VENAAGMISNKLFSKFKSKSTNKAKPGRDGTVIYS